MTLYKVLLKSTQLIRRDVFIAQRTETGSYTVKRGVGSSNLLIQIIATFLNTQLCFGSKLQFQIFNDKTLDNIESKINGTYEINVINTIKY